MKPLLTPLAMTAFASAILLSGCASTESGTAATTTKPTPVAPQTGNRGDRGNWNKTPEVGMTKDEVLARYGDPKEVTQTPQGEVWSYRPRVRSRDFIPVYGAFTHQYKGGTIGFDKAGRVKGFDWGTSRYSIWW